MRIKCKPEEAKYATVGEVEFKDDGTEIEPVWGSSAKGCALVVDTKTLVKMNATFETDLPPVPDGKEYEYKKGDDQWFVKEGCHAWDDEEGRWIAVGPTSHLSAPGYIYAIPIKKESCVVEGVVLYNATQSVALEKQVPGGMSVLVIPKNRVTSQIHDDGRLLIVVREDKVG